MAITKLMHMKEDPVYPSKHLRDTINYILDVKNNGKKTEYGLWVGGNAGTEASEVYHQFMETKRFYEKEDGRQGYHFVISFAPNETNEATCFQVLKDFCEEYLGDKFEYVFAVHNDQDHIHGHIVFNSVSRMDGYKYHYKKGDWEKYIQPVTDKISQKYNLSPLVYSEEKVGVSYSEWAHKEKEGKFNWTHIIRADVDYSIENSSNMEEFFLSMKKMGYELRMGYSKKREESYVTFSIKDAEGKIHKRRNYKLLSGTDEYSLQRISQKIENKEMINAFHKTLSESLAKKSNLYLGNNIYLKGYKTFNRLYQAVSYYKLPNPFAVPSYQVRQDMVRIDKLIEECAYLKRNPIKSVKELQERYERLDNNLKTLYITRKNLKDVKSTFMEVIPNDLIMRYFQLRDKVADDKSHNDAWELLEDELVQLESHLPSSFLENDEALRVCEGKIELLKREKRILERVIQSEGGKDVVMSYEMSMDKKPKI